MAGKFVNVPLAHQYEKQNFKDYISVFACDSPLLQFTCTLHYCQSFSKSAVLFYMSECLFHHIIHHNEHCVCFYFLSKLIYYFLVMQL